MRRSEALQRFTPMAVRVAQHAKDRARRADASQVGTEHLLLGLLQEPEGIAAQALTRLGVVFRVVRDEVARLPVTKVGEGRTWSAEARQALECALDEAVELSAAMGRPGIVGTEHLLLALTRDQTCTAIRVLRTIGVEPTRVRQEVLRLIRAIGEGARFLQTATTLVLDSPEEVPAPPPPRRVWEPMPVEAKAAAPTPEPESPEPTLEAQEPESPEPTLEAQEPESPEPAPEAPEPEPPEPTLEAQEPEPTEPAPEAQEPEPTEPTPEAQEPEPSEPTPEAQEPEPSEPTPEAQEPEPTEPAAEELAMQAEPEPAPPAAEPEPEAAPKPVQVAWTGPPLTDVNACFGYDPHTGVATAREAIREAGERWGVRSAYAFSLAALRYGTRAGNEETLAGCEEDDFLRPVAVLCPTGHRPLEMVTWAKARGFAFARIFPDVHGFAVDGQACRDLLSACGAEGLPVMVSALAAGPGALERGLDGIRGTVILTDNRYGILGEVLALAGRVPDLYLEVSGVNTPDGIAVLAEAFGVDRLLWGSGYPALQVGCAAMLLQHSGLRPEQIALIGHGTAQRLLGG